MQLCVNEIVQHKLALTWGDFVSEFFFLAPHGMCRRDQEKRPAGIVRNQRKPAACTALQATLHYVALHLKESVTLIGCQKLNIGGFKRWKWKWKWRRRATWRFSGDTAKENRLGEQPGEEKKVARRTYNETWMIYFPRKFHSVSVTITKLVHL